MEHTPVIIELIMKLTFIIILSSYSFEKFKTSKNNTIDKVSILIEDNSKEYQKKINEISHTYSNQRNEPHQLNITHTYKNQINETHILKSK